MKVITTREIRQEMKTYFKLAETERVAVKRGNKYVNLIVTDDPDMKFVPESWIKDFMSIPMQYRCNPFDSSPSGDLFYADKRNLDRLDQAIEQAGKGQTIKLSREEQAGFLGL